MHYLTLNDIERIALDNQPLVIPNDIKTNIQRSFDFLAHFSNDKIIYGINTGFGPMAQFKIEANQLQQLQYNLIRSHCSGVGKTLSDSEARAVLLARINNFLQGHSGVSSGVIEQLERFLHHRITPEIYEHGGVGASGDLIQLAHLALNLIGEGYVRFHQQRQTTQSVFKTLNIAPLQLQLRDGLALINGTSCMTAIGAINIIYAKRLLNWAIALSASLNEIVESFDDSFSEGLNQAKLHHGQALIAKKMRSHLRDSTLIQKREQVLETITNNQHFKKKIQEYYSLRCVPQILGPIHDTLEYAQEVVEHELNSTNDNPIVDIHTNEVLHGGNFHGDYIALEMDKVKIVITKLSILLERQLNFLLNNKLNDQFPPFLNAQTLGLNFGLQGLQFVATSTTAENQVLSNPMYVHSIPSNNDNQDVVSMGTNSAIITRKVIENSFQIIAIHTIAVCQAIDLLPQHKIDQLSRKTRELHAHIRSHVPFITHDTPQFEAIAKIVALKEHDLFRNIQDNKK